MKKQLILVLFSLLLWGVSPAWAQVATPSLDPTRPTKTAAAGVWRFGSTLAIEGTSHEYESPANQIKAEASRTSALIAWQPTLVTFDLYGYSGAKEQIWDPSSDTYSEQTRDYGRFGAAIRGEGQVGLGVGMTSETIDDGVVRKRTSNNGNLSFRMGDFYIGGGIAKVTEKVSGYDEKRWNRVLAGVAYRYGNPDSNQFRLEYSLIQDAGEDQGEIWADVVPPTKEAIASLEFMLWGVRLSYEGSTITEKEVLGWTTDRVTIWHHYGVGLQGDNLSLGLYRRDGNQNFENNEQLMRNFGLSFGFSFI